MGVTKTAAEYKISVEGVFAIDDIYTEAKQLIESLDYQFTEKEQEVKPNQYGRQVKFVLCGSKNLDPFASSAMEAKFSFKNMSKVKTNGATMSKGKLSVKIKFTVTYDRKDKWAQNFFLEKMFKLYMNYIGGGTLKNRYFKPVGKQGMSFYNSLKELLDLYT